MSQQKQEFAWPVFRVVALQFLIASVFASLVVAFVDRPSGWSAAYGGMVSVAGSLLYALMIVRMPPDAGTALRGHVRAEMLKIFVTVLLFILALVLFSSASWLWLIAGFAVTAFVANWLSLLTV
ncbi:ATP synthase subunit I [Massilia sp. TS11]|uniref:ATP synthase subunit I n=1 Tax=Massilia sp. TS11 TaxID=2908003 RepID=UPI001EDA48B4|nr:ATP synthase subunit I [Massilia sp. TS11]MCG2585235.1 ATP synthase subunit I [Massilia sp. TS11]